MVDRLIRILFTIQQKFIVPASSRNIIFEMKVTTDDGMEQFASVLFKILESLIKQCVVRDSKLSSQPCK